MTLNKKIMRFFDVHYGNRMAARIDQCTCLTACAGGYVFDAIRVERTTLLR